MSDLSQIEKLLKDKIVEIKQNTLKACAIEWRRTITKNFESKGRPIWAARKRISKRQRGTNILVISGAMKNVSTVPDFESSSVILKVDPRARAYAKIHNEGGVINMPARNLKFRKNKKGRTVFASSSHKKIIKETTGKAYRITIPKREYTNVPQDDFPRWVSTIKQLNNL